MLEEEHKKERKEKVSCRFNTASFLYILPFVVFTSKKFRSFFLYLAGVCMDVCVWCAYVRRGTNKVGNNDVYVRFTVMLTMSSRQQYMFVCVSFGG